MNEKEGLLSSEWISIARKDWNRVYHMLQYDDFEASGLFLQQSLEKYLKAFLLQQGWKLRKIHELDALLDEAVKFDPELENFRDLCERISGYYLAERYPPLGHTYLTHEDIENGLIEARKFIRMMFPSEKFRVNE
jgi:HEPN domain-containing protein